MRKIGFQPRFEAIQILVKGSEDRSGNGRAYLEEPGDAIIVSVLFRKMMRALREEAPHRSDSPHSWVFKQLSEVHGFFERHISQRVDRGTGGYESVATPYTKLHEQTMGAFRSFDALFSIEDWMSLCALKGRDFSCPGASGLGTHAFKKVEALLRGNYHARDVDRWFWFYCAVGKDTVERANAEQHILKVLTEQMPEEMLIWRLCHWYAQPSSRVFGEKLFLAMGDRIQSAEGWQRLAEGAARAGNYELHRVILQHLSPVAVSS